MRVLRASVLGYCMGVRRAVDMAYAESRPSIPGEPGAEAAAPEVYTMGPLIHNPQVLGDLRRRGVAVLDEGAIPGDLTARTVIIRAHGVTPLLEETLHERGARLVDATCPKVKANQMKARELSRAGYRIFLAGERRHGEIAGIQGYAPGCIIVADREEAEQAARRLQGELGYGDAEGGLKPRGGPGDADPRVALIGQTTISWEEYRSIGDGIQRYFPGVERINTICGATRDRQNALKELCAQVDALIVAGGWESANTRRLRAIAEAQGKPVWLLESAGEIPPEIRAYGTVGLSAGASTPDEVIDAIEAALTGL